MEQIVQYGFVHVLLICTSIYLFGYFYAIPGLILIVLAIDKVLENFGYRRLKYLDLLSSYQYITKPNRIGGYMEIDKITHEEFQDIFVERALTKIPKLRYILVKIFGIRMYKEINI